MTTASSASTNNLLELLSKKGYVKLRQLDSSPDNIVLLDKLKSCVIRIGLTKPIEDIRQEAEFVTFLNDTEVPTAKVRDCFILDDNGKNLGVIVSDFVEHKADVKPTDKVIQESAHALRKLHKASHTFLKTHEFSQQRNLVESLQKFLELVDTDYFGKPKNKSDVKESIEWAINFLNKNPDQKNVILHNDYRIQNILINSNDTVAAIIDFDWIVTATGAEKDVAHSAMEFSMTDGSLVADLKQFNTFTDAYYEHEVYDKNLMYTWARFAALYDAAHYFISYPERTTKIFSSYMYDKSLYFEALVKNG